MFDHLQPHGLYSPWNSLGQNTGVGSLSLLQGIYPTQGWKPGLPHCRRILYQVSHQRNPRIPEWVAYPFPRRSSWSRNQARVSCIAGRFFTNWATREGYYLLTNYWLTQFSWVQFSHSVMCNSLQPHGLQHVRFPVHHNSWSLLKLMSIVLVMPSNHLILCSPLLLPPSVFPSIREKVLPMSQFFTSGVQSIGASVSASVPSKNIQAWFPLGFAGWIYLLSKGPSRVFSNTTVQKHQFLNAQLSL